MVKVYQVLCIYSYNKLLYFWRYLISRIWRGGQICENKSHAKIDNPNTLLNKHFAIVKLIFAKITDNGDLRKKVTAKLQHNNMHSDVTLKFPAHMERTRAIRGRYTRYHMSHGQPNIFLYTAAASMSRTHGTQDYDNGTSCPAVTLVSTVTVIAQH